MELARAYERGNLKEAQGETLERFEKIVSSGLASVQSSFEVSGRPAEPRK